MIFSFSFAAIIIVIASHCNRQSQIENKIGTIQNVIEMLNGILSADKSDSESPMKAKPAKETPVSDDSSPERLKTKVIESLYKKRKDSDRSRKDE